MDIERVRIYVQLRTMKSELEDQVTAIQADLAKLEGEILEDFSRDGVQHVSMDGQTVYLHQQLWAKARDGDYHRACAALCTAGLSEMVEPRFNTQTLSSWVREHLKDGGTLPAALEECIEVTEKFSVRTRKASNGE